MADKEESLRDLGDQLHTELVPGTEVMTDVGDHHFLKSSHLNVVLVPQPTEDIHDPLNWHPLWKAAVMFSTCLLTFSQSFGPLAIAPIFPILGKEFHASLPDVVQFTGVTILVLGFANFLWVPLSETFGRRFVFIVSAAINLASIIWRAESTSYGAFYGAAILAGIGCGPSETIQPAVTADVIFLHERGFYTTLYFVVFTTGLMLGPLIQGAMAESVGWRSFWWLNVAIAVLTLICIIFLFPETKYPRKSQIEEQLDRKDSTALSATGNKDDLKTIAGKGKPSWAQFKPFQIGPQPLQTLFRAFWQPWQIMLYPIVQFASFMVGFSAACFLIINLVQAEALGAPPYKFGPLAIGLTNLAALVGIYIGLATAGPLSDTIARKLTVRNNGIREPEMRLLTMVPYVAIMLLGNFVTAFGLQNGWDWRAVVIVGFGCAGIQVAALPSIASTYAIDSYKPAAGSIFVSVTVNKNLWGYGLSRFVTPMILKSGFVPPFMLNMCLLCLWSSCGILLWFYGKRLRKFTAKSSVHRE